jgi:hypothetical protein
MTRHATSATTSENKRPSASKLNEKICTWLTTTVGTAAVTGLVYEMVRIEAITSVMSAIIVDM